MARQSQNKFIKRQKELERMRKAKEKMARRQGKKDKEMESDEPLTSDQSLETSNSWTLRINYCYDEIRARVMPGPYKKIPEQPLMGCGFISSLLMQSALGLRMESRYL
jgi:hypothetical protein